MKDLLLVILLCIMLAGLLVLAISADCKRVADSQPELIIHLKSGKTIESKGSHCWGKNGEYVPESSIDYIEEKKLK